MKPKPKSIKCKACNGSGQQVIAESIFIKCYVCKGKGIRDTYNKCLCCNEARAIPDDKYGRCKNCLIMVPTRRGGWRQLGVYDG